ncbi:cyclic AMP-responsive element-binding protein 3-like protein 3-A [Cololabis saira]|uniref:cyclic AMP-responsive element-binding protein 3-like protein 3-A n=1 Tax=Cololabis saira TaxID=129043 RepID=UPI002AD43275|nr:cyclic AMP-responsive element-binding protein 3-like protein 3-A [Cololabis saira]
MQQYPDQGGDSAELLDWLFDKNDGILRHEETGHRGNNPSWPFQGHNMLQPAQQADEDFLNALLTGGHSVKASPLWSPSPSDSGISEDPPSDQMDSPHRPESPPEETECFGPIPPSKAALDGNVSTDLNVWDYGFPTTNTRMTPYPSDIQRPQLSTGFPLTVKDLLLSGTPEPPPQPSQTSVQDLILNEDEKKLLAKEGVTLPSQLPLTKYEERILKKIRRKIRNKQSAQESRKKKKEYIDGLENRMTACSVHNQELQRKVSQLEKCNMSLMEQLRRLQALVMNSTNKPAQTGTCVLVFLLSFSLILFPNLKPFSDTEVSQEDFTLVRIQSRFLQNVQESHEQRVINYEFPAEEEPEHLHKHLPGEQELEDFAALMGKLRVKQEQSSSTSVSMNSSQEDPISHYQIDPITGHITSLTLHPQRSASLRPHADDM